VIEGVFMYLTQDAIHNTINVLQELYPGHTLICDLMNKTYFDKFAYKIHEKLAAVGGRFTGRPDKPEEIFIKNNYIKIENIPISERVIKSGVLWRQLKIPGPVFRLIMNLFMKDL
jgi:O-methyltransferase involved in polyketide biosynthesis